MAQFDMSIQALESYTSAGRSPADFDAFWRTTLLTRPLGEATRLTLVDTGFVLVDTYDMVFSGFDGQSVRAWMRVPKVGTSRLPVVVEFVGYNGGRGLPTEPSMWCQAGFIHVTMDNRGQGSGTSAAHTSDAYATPAGPAQTAFVTRGIESREAFYYRRLFADAVHCIGAVRELDRVDPACVFITGASQGGAIGLAVAALVDDLAGVMVDVPFLCDIERAIALTDAEPFAFIARYMTSRRGEESQVLDVLAYFDGVNFAARATAPALFSVALMDAICPPSTVYAAYNEYGGMKEIDVYPFNGHEGGQATHQRRQLAWALTRTRR